MTGLTEPRRRALAVLAHHPTGRYSNETNPEAGLVYWKAADWLLAEGIAHYPQGPAAQLLALTPRGRALAEQEGLLPPEPTFPSEAWCPKCSRAVSSGLATNHGRPCCPKCGAELEELGTGDDDPYPEESPERVVAADSPAADA